MDKNTVYRGSLFPRGDIKEGDLFQAVTSTGKVVRLYEFKDGDWEEQFDNKKELVYDQEEAIEFIRDKITHASDISTIGIDINDEQLATILDLDEDYMRSKGIITEE